jgi:hypothetical protein
MFSLTIISLVPFCFLLLVILQHEHLSIYERDFFHLHGQISPSPPEIVSSIQQFYANLMYRFSFAQIAQCIDFNVFNLAGGSVLVGLLSQTTTNMSSDLDFFYVGSTFDDFVESLV